MTEPHVRLRLGPEAYALPVRHVLEAADTGHVTPVPGSAPFVLGVRNLRGQILPVVDLARVLGLPREGTPPRVLVAEDGGRRAGLAVDEIEDVAELPEPDEGTATELLAGATLVGPDLVGILDVPALFDRLASPEEPERRA